MYHYIQDKEFLKKMRRLCSDIINQLVQSINNDSIMTVEAHLVGSGAKNLITQNEKESVDLDYNLCIIKYFGNNINDGKYIKEHIQKHFNHVLSNNGWGDCQDSTSALTTEQRVFNKGNRTPFSIDLAIVKERNGKWQRLIHQKTGFVNLDQWVWNDVQNSNDVLKRIDKIKKNNLWLEVRETYLDKKNMYLRRQDNSHPSFNIYIETINEIYYKYFR